MRYKEKAAAANAMEALHLQEMKDFPGFKVTWAAAFLPVASALHPS